MSTPSPSPSALIDRLGRFGPGSIALMLLLLTLLGVGISGYLVQHHHGEIATGMRTIGHGGVAWGLYICFVIYFIGISFAGISTAALVRLFRLEALKPLTRIAELLTLVTLPMGALCVLADLGRPLHGLLLLPRYARPFSPFFGTFTLVVSGYLFASLVYFYLAGRADAARCAENGPRWLRPLYVLWASGWRDTPSERRRHHQVEFWLALFVLPLLVTAHSTLGFVFGIQGGRPGWYGSLQAPAFVVLAGCSGIGMLIVVVAAVRRAQGLYDVIPDKAFGLLGNFMWVLTLAYLYFMVVEELTANYAAGHAETHTAHAVVSGRYAPLFWIAVAGLVIPVMIGFAQFALRRVHVGWLVVAGLLINVAAVLKRFLLVVPSQTEGMLLSYDRGTYIPTWVEVRVVIGLFALASLLYVTFAKLFPIVPLPEPPELAPVPSTGRRSGVRSALFVLTLGLGLTLVVVGFLLCLRMGTLPFLDPVVPFSPVVFIAGVMLTFYSAAVYETVPDRRPPASPAGETPA
jgi:molybdopterin-containing oxidoreductase family membrane subunit